MKIALPVGEDKQTVHKSLGRAPFFLFVQTDTDEREFVENPAAVSQGGAGILAAQSLVDEKIDVLLAPQCGENASQVLEAAKMKIYQTSGTSIEENLTAFQEGNLKPLVEFHKGFHGGH